MATIHMVTEDSIPIRTIMEVTTAGNMLDDNLKLCHLEDILRHIEHVRDDCNLLGHRLIDLGEIDLGVDLIANGQVHDNSKLHGIELLYLNDDTKNTEPELFRMAWQQHVTTNPHHPEYWGSIDNVPRIFLAEWVCDCHARSSEFGTDLREWIKEQATKRFKLNTCGKTYKQIKEFLDLLLERKFTNANLYAKEHRNGSVRNGKVLQTTETISEKE
jgi:hypothetical protein